MRPLGCAVPTRAGRRYLAASALAWYNEDAMVAAKDIGDDLVIAAIRTASAQRAMNTASRWDVEALLPQYPPKVILAKCRSMLRRGLIEGCGCGCRGDWEIPTAP